MAQNMMNYFKIVVIVMLFYSMCITLLTYSLPAGAVNYVTGFSEVAQDINLNSTSAEVRESLEAQTDIPVVELGALVFYSGNIIVDLLLNFLFAVPEMIGMLVNGVMLLLNIDSYVFAVVQIFASVAVSMMYLIGVIQLLTSIRSGRMV